MYFTYGETELSYLRQKDKRLGEVIDRVGPVRRAVDTDLFSAVVHHIVGQQISTKAQATIWQRMQDALGRVNAENVLAAGVPRLTELEQIQDSLSPCELCAEGKHADSAVYVTETGDRYHLSIGCSGLKRTVTRVRRSDVTGLPYCSECGR